MGLEYDGKENLHKMKLVLVILLLPSLCFAADPWSKNDIALETTWQVIHLVDWLQTREVARNPEKYKEVNCLLGDHPSEGKVNLFMFGSSLAHLGITHIIPARCRPYWEIISIGVTGACVISNFSLGIKIKF